MFSAAVVSSLVISIYGSSGTSCSSWMIAVFFALIDLFLFPADAARFYAAAS